MKQDGVNFETAITETGYGKFNLLLMLITFPAGWANCFASVTMSYVFPAAQCDLGLSLEDKGLLNAITYSGMISSAFIWGFLFDTLGRKKLLVIGYFLNFLCTLITAASQNKEMLIAGKFFEGFIINGPYAAFSTYISEFHSVKNRGRMQLFIAIVFCIGGIVLPWTAFAILSNPIAISIGVLKFYSWNIFLLVCSIPPLLAFLIFPFMPESPKFLMTIGENEKALELFRTIYSINNGQPKENYPESRKFGSMKNIVYTLGLKYILIPQVDRLIDEIALKGQNSNVLNAPITPKRTHIEALQDGWKQFKPLFFLPYLPIISLICSIQTLFTMNVNTLRLWLPQIFQALNDFEYYTGESPDDICLALDIIQPNNVTTECVFNVDNASVYINLSVSNVIVILCEIFAGIVVIYIRKKILLFLFGVLAGLFVFVLYFSTNIVFAVAFSALYTGFAAVAANIVLVVIIDLFPTTLRTMSVSLSLMFGRIGSMIGNLIFPLLIQAGCETPFFTCGSLIIVSAFLALLLPNSEHKDLM